MNEATSPGTSARRLASASMLSRLDDLHDLRLDRLADIGKLLRLAHDGELGNRGGRVADAGRRAAVGADAERLLAQDLREVGQLVEPIGQIAVARERRDHKPIIGPPGRARLADACRRLPPHLQRAGESRADGAGARRADRHHARSDPRHRRQLPGRDRCRCRCARRRARLGRGSAPAGQGRARAGLHRRASGGPSRRAPSSCSRSTATSRTTRRTCLA